MRMGCSHLPLLLLLLQLLLVIFKDPKIYKCHLLRNNIQEGVMRITGG
jgi:hypothetical protein